MKLGLEDIRRLDIKPGQILVATLPERATAEDMQAVRDVIQDYLPEVRLLVVSAGVDLMVLNPQDLTADLLGLPPQ